MLNPKSKDLVRALTDDRPTYPPPAGPRPNWPTLQIPTQPAPDAMGTLQAISAYLEKGGDPVAYKSPSATYLATMSEGLYVFNLGPGPDARHEQEPYHRVLQLQRQGDKWSTTQICTRASEGATVWQAPGHQPVLICTAPMGQGKPYLHVSLWRGSTEILAAEHLVAVPDGVTIVDPPAGAADSPPDVQLLRSVDFFGYGRTTDYLTERLTLTWLDGAYKIAQREWQADWAYHTMRFLSLLEIGDYDRAAQEFSFQPEGGLAQYLDQHAPEIARYAGKWCWPRRNMGGHGFLLCGSAEEAPNNPWFWFDYAPDGRIAAIGKQMAPPKES